MNKFALLSIVPGLGQLYLGDKRKGILFLEVALINYVLLAVVCFSQSIAKALWSIGQQYNIRPNYEMIAALNNMHLGSPVSFLLICAMLVFWRYATCDATQKAEGKKRSAIYRDSAIEFSEATSTSYVGHVALIISCMLLAIMFVHPPKHPAQIVDIQFMEEQDAPKPTVTPKTSLVSKQDVESHSRRRMHDTPRVAHNAPAPAHAASRSATSAAAQNAPAPAPTPRVAHVPAPLPTPIPVAHAVNALAPAPAPATAPRTDVILTTPFVPTPLKKATSMAAPPMTPLAPSRLAVDAAALPPTVPSLHSASAAVMPVTPTAISGINTAGFSHSEGLPPGAFRGRHSSGAAAAAPMIISSRGSGTASGGAPNVVAIAPRGTSGSNGTAGANNGAISPVRASSRGDSAGSFVPVAPSTSPSSPSSDGPRGMDSVATKAGEPDFTRYMAELQRKIKRNWFPPRDAESRRITVQFKVALDGSMSGLRITKSSGIGIADQAALNAVQNAAPFASLPKNSPDAVDIEFTFDYNVFNGGTGARIRTW